MVPAEPAPVVSPTSTDTPRHQGRGRPQGPQGHLLQRCPQLPCSALPVRPVCPVLRKTGFVAFAEAIHGAAEDAAAVCRPSLSAGLCFMSGLCTGSPVVPRGGGATGCPLWGKAPQITHFHQGQVCSPEGHSTKGLHSPSNRLPVPRLALKTKKRAALHVSGRVTSCCPMPSLSFCQIPPSRQETTNPCVPRTVRTRLSRAVTLSAAQTEFWKFGQPLRRKPHSQSFRNGAATRAVGTACLAGDATSLTRTLKCGNPCWQLLAEDGPGLLANSNPFQRSHTSPNSS